MFRTGKEMIVLTIVTKLLTTVYAPEDQLICDWLKGEGIEVFVQKKAFSPLEVSIGPLAEIKIFVRPEQYEEAKRLLEAMELPPTDLE